MQVIEEKEEKLEDQEVPSPKFVCHENPKRIKSENDICVAIFQGYKVR